MKINRNQVSSYITKDSSEIRELLHPEKNPVKNQSLAEAIVQPQQTTAAHFHKKTEEIYFILKGTGEMRLDDRYFIVEKSDSVLISPGQVHSIKNIGDTKLRFLCCCAPAYDHADTFLTETEPEKN